MSEVANTAQKINGTKGSRGVKDIRRPMNNWYKSVLIDAKDEKKSHHFMKNKRLWYLRAMKYTDSRLSRT